jgi:hypothetical protein
VKRRVILAWPQMHNVAGKVSDYVAWDHGSIG